MNVALIRQSPRNRPFAVKRLFSMRKCSDIAAVDSPQPRMFAMRRFSQIALSSVSFVAMAAASPAVAGAASAQAPAPLPEQCANIQDEAAKQACASAAEQADPLANAGEQETAPTQGGVASAESTP